jgi:hypothetical protein
MESAEMEEAIPKLARVGRYDDSKYIPVLLAIVLLRNQMIDILMSKHLQYQWEVI